MKTEKFSRKPFTVEAVQVTAENMEDVARWTKGSIHETPPEIAEKFKKPIQKWVQIEVTHSMNDRQTKAFIDDYVLYANRGFKIYTPKAFERNFERPSTREVKIHVEDNRHGDVDPGGRKPAPSPAQVFKRDGEVVPVPKVEEIKVTPTGQAQVFSQTLDEVPLAHTPEITPAERAALRNQQKIAESS